MQSIIINPHLLSLISAPFKCTDEEIPIVSLNTVTFNTKIWEQIHTAKLLKLDKRLNSSKIRWSYAMKQSVRIHCLPWLCWDIHSHLSPTRSCISQTPSQHIWWRGGGGGSSQLQSHHYCCPDPLIISAPCHMQLTAVLCVLFDWGVKVGE